MSSNNQFKLPNFVTYTTNRPLVNGRPPAGGTAILVNRRYIHHKVTITTTSVTNTSIQIRTNDEELTLVAVYKSPKTLLQTRDIENILNSAANVIIVGDLNAKHHAWNSSKINTTGRVLLKYIDSRLDATVAAPTTPTSYSTQSDQSPAVLDIAIVKAGSLSYHIENLPNELSSDHSPVLLEIHHRSTHISPTKPRT